MKSKTTAPMVISTLICLLPMILAAVLYEKLPEQVAVHFTAAGMPDGFLPKAAAAFGLPAAMALLNLFTHFRLNHDPKVENASAAMKQAAKWAIPLISVVVMPITLFISMGASLPIGTIVAALVGVVIVVCGNYLPKCRRNYTVGIKLPWTLDNEDNWNKTHRFAGFLWVLCGLAFIANAFLSLAYVSLVLLGLMMILPPVYSYAMYRKQ